MSYFHALSLDQMQLKPVLFPLSFPSTPMTFSLGFVFVRCVLTQMLLPLQEQLVQEQQRLWVSVQD